MDKSFSEYLYEFSNSNLDQEIITFHDLRPKYCLFSGCKYQQQSDMECYNYDIKVIKSVLINSLLDIKEVTLSMKKNIR